MLAAFRNVYIVFTQNSIWVFLNIGFFSPKMDGENNGKPYEQMDDLGGPPLFLETPISLHISCIFGSLDPWILGSLDPW